MNEEESEREKGFIQGERATYRSLLGVCTRALYSEDTTKEELMIHLEDTRSALRSLCEDFGDNEWDDDLHLADVVNKHLGNHLYSKE